MSHPQLTTGALLDIMSGEMVDNPILQIIGSKRLDSSTAEKSRHRILLSDGKYKVSHAMYTVPASDTLVSNGEIAEHTIVRIKRCIISTLGVSNKGGDRKVIVVLDLEVVKDGKLVGEVIGHPEALSNDLPANKENKSSSSHNNESHSRPSSEYEPSPKRANTSTTPPSMNSTISTDIVMPISSLSPYQNKWVIKARVTNKSPIRTWSNSKGEGKLFSFEMLDHSGEIRATAFKEMVDKYYDFLQVEKVYYVSKCQVKMANKQYSSLKNDYELAVGHETVIQECQEVDDDMPTVQYNFVTFDKIAELDSNSVIDAIGVCKQAGELQTLIARTSGRELKKRDVILVDQTKTSITLTLWGNDAEQFEANSQILAVKGARVNEFGGGKSITVPQGGICKANPDVKEAFALRGWFDNGGNREETSNLSARTGSGGGSANWMSFKQVQVDNLGSSERGDYFQNVATIMFVNQERLMYQACATESCNKKVIDMENGKYRCEKCNTETPEFKYRIIGNITLGDWSGSQWVTVFNNECEYIFGVTAQQLGDGAKNDPLFVQNIINDTNFKEFQFRYRVKTETYNDDSRLQTAALKVEPVNYKSYNAYLISQIQQMTE